MDPQTPHKSAAWNPRAGRQRRANLWGSLASQPSLIGELQTNERASISEEVGKWPPEDVTGRGEVGGEGDRKREKRERESYDFKPECLGWSVNSDKGKLLVCEGLQNGGS